MPFYKKKGQKIIKSNAKGMEMELFCVRTKSPIFLNGNSLGNTIMIIVTSLKKENFLVTQGCFKA